MARRHNHKQASKRYSNSRDVKKLKSKSQHLVVGQRANFLDYLPPDQVSAHEIHRIAEDVFGNAHYSLVSEM